MSDKKGYIHFWCKMTLYRAQRDPVADNELGKPSINSDIRKL